MNKMWVVARREYRTTVRTKAFVVAIVLMPIFMLGGFAVQSLTEDRIDVDAKKVAVLDPNGRLFDIIVAASESRNKAKTDDFGILDPETGEQVKPKYVFERVPIQADSPDEQRVELSDQVRSKVYFAFIEVTGDVFDYASGDARLNYYSNEPTYDDLRRWLSYIVDERVRSERFAAAGLDIKLVGKAMKPVELENLGLYERDADTGAIKQAEKVNRAATFLVPITILMLMWMALMMTTQPILSGVIEEKMQKISEVLLGSARPFEIMMGKLVGFVGVAVTLVGIYAVGGWTVANYYGHADMIPMHLLGWLGVFLSLAIFMFGSMFLAAGSCCNDLREAQNLVMPIWLVLLIPMFTFGTVLQHPSSSFAVWLSLFPPATPMLMMIRLSMAPIVPMWQIAVGIVGTIITTLICVWAAGRIFRIGLLMQGKPPKPLEILKWVVRG
ncbi:MAG: ABC transporter permease [Planctomycetia bacterium]|nr:ABC transporter permease [Planctomycetia bacterium]OQZ05516.1 MAG: hypothetical protein B6D36_09750 [Planctomycetes bacterium UTPLA1]